MKTVKVTIEKSQTGYSAYMEDDSLDYAMFPDEKTVKRTIEAFYEMYEEFRESYRQQGKHFEEVEFSFRFDVSSFLEYYSKYISLAGLERLTGVNQKQLGHYLSGHSKPTRKTIARIEKGVRQFAENLSSVRFI